MADGDIVEELHAHLDEQQMLPDQHLMDMGYVDAEVLAESQCMTFSPRDPAVSCTSCPSKRAALFSFWLCGRRLTYAHNCCWRNAGPFF
jgi:transposase